MHLVMGDPGGDGHGRSAERVCVTNLTSSELKEAYKAGAALLGVDFSRDVCSEYQCNRVSVETAEKLKSFGCTVFDNIGQYDFDEDSGYSIWHDEFVAIYLFLCKLGNPKFKFELVSDKADSIAIGGYGMF